MKSRWVAVFIVVIVLVMSLGIVGQAVAGSTTDEIIKDAGDGTLDGNYSQAQINAALDYLRDNPIATQYSGAAGVLEDYLMSFQAPGSQGGELAFTGGEVVLLFAAGIGLVGSGVFLRRRGRAQ